MRSAIPKDRREFVDAVWASDLKPSCTLVALAYAKFAAEDVNGVWVVRSELKNHTRLSSDGAAAALRELERRGWLEIQAPGVGKRSTRYGLRIPYPQTDVSDPGIGSRDLASDPGIGSEESRSDPITLGSDPIWARSDPISGVQTVEPLEPSPQAPQRELQALGVPLDGWAEILKISKQLGARSPTARLTASPEHRADAAAEYHRRRTARQAEDDATGPHCPECDRPQRICQADAAPASRIPPEARCRRHSPMTSHAGRPAAATGAA